MLTRLCGRCFALFAVLFAVCIRSSVAMSTFSELLALSVPDLMARLEQEHVKSDELKAFCKFLGLTQSGSKVAMVEKILDRVGSQL